MKKALMILVAIVALGALGLSAWGCGTASAAEGTPGSVYVVGQNTGISVTGTGKVTVIPDLAILSMGVQVQAATVDEAQQQAAVAMTAVLDALKASGIAEKDITTTGYSVYPVYEYESEKIPTITGYNVSNSISVKVRKVEDAGDIIDIAAAAGGDSIRINGISFTVDNPEQYNEQARELAMADALQRAEQLASLGGVELGKPAYITESGSYTPSPVYYESVGRDATTPSVATPVTPGETIIQLSVQVIYNIQ